LLYGLLPACARIQKDLGTPITHAEAWTVGAETHYSDVLAIYGPPSKISATPTGSAFLYEHVEIDERQWGLILPGKIGKYFKAVYARSEVKADVAVFAFDRRGRLVGQAGERIAGDPGGGFALSIIFKIKSLTDTDPYTRSQEGILSWGAAALQPVPVVLNAAQSPDSGSAGLEVIRVDGVMGQRTLEMRRGD
jgi:hypothetical protein